MRAQTAVAVRARGMRELMADMSAEEQHLAAQRRIDNLAPTRAEMFALELEGWSTGPGPWHYFGLIQAPTLSICGEHEEPDAAAHAHGAAQAIPRGRSIILPGVGDLEAFWRAALTVPLVRGSATTRFPPRRPAARDWPPTGGQPSVCGMSALLPAVRDDGSVARSRGLGRAEVLAAAHAACHARGWPWREPTKVTGRLFRLKVWTNANIRDDNPWFVFSRDGRLVQAGWAGRLSRH